MEFWNIFPSFLIIDSCSNIPSTKRREIRVPREISKILPYVIIGNYGYRLILGNNAIPATGDQTHNRSITKFQA